MAWISTAKLAAVSIAAAFLALAAEIAPRAWSSVGAWLRPPYLYLVVNGIILAIAASSRFHYCYSNRNDTDDDDDEARTEEKLSAATSAVVVAVPPEDCCCRRDCGREVVVVKEVIKLADHQNRDRCDDEKESTVEMIPTRNESSWECDDDDEMNLELFVENPRRELAKPIITSPQGDLRALKASKPKQHETLENTWKMITEGRSTPLNRQMNKCDTWENRRRQIIDRALGPPAVEKSETFKERTNQQLPAVVPKLRKQPSLSQDELNKRVEAFIKKFNEQMRLQRQESLNQYLEMINRGAQ